LFNSLVECGNDGFDLDGQGSFTILETFIFAAGDDGFDMEIEPNGILNLERSTVVKSVDGGMAFDYEAWNVEVISSLFADNGGDAFQFAVTDGDDISNMLTLIDTSYDGINRTAQNALKIITSVKSTPTTTTTTTRCARRLASPARTSARSSPPPSPTTAAMADPPRRSVGTVSEGRLSLFHHNKLMSGLLFFLLTRNKTYLLFNFLFSRHAAAQSNDDDEYEN
jgi:hypothetical protein